MRVEQSIFDLMYDKYVNTKPIRLIELFGGYGSQHFALEYLDANFEHWKLCEWAVKSIQAYKDAHYSNNNTDYFSIINGDNKLDKEWLINYLYNKHISMDYNEPMSLKQIKSKNEEWLRQVYNNIITTKNTVDITQTKASDLEIEDTDKYTYIMTYSFPCQDLSLAGLGKGMARDSGTRSGMLWQVERILDECTELPQILLMENVPEVKGTNNVKYFNEWQNKLESLGYKNYHQNLIATDYGIPQTRNRTFMISILGNYSYTFPNAIPLKLKLKDMLEKEVDKKYYLSDKFIKMITINKDTENYIEWERINGQLEHLSGAYKEDKSVCTLHTKSNEVKVLETTGNKALKETLENANEIKDGSFIDSYNKNVRDDNVAGTITTGVSFRNNTFVATGGVKIPEATKQGYAIAHDGDGVYINRPHQKRGVVQKDKMQTLKTSPDTGVVVDDNRFYKQAFETLNENVVNFGDTINAFNKSVETSGLCPTITTRPEGFKTAILPIEQNLRIRKLTPKECFRLMGVKDEDYDKIAKNQSEASLYHLAGDSIVINVLMAIFGELLDIDWKGKL